LAVVVECLEIKRILGDRNQCGRVIGLSKRLIDQFGFGIVEQVLEQRLGLRIGGGLF
jgi:hypothetical protein